MFVALTSTFTSEGENGKNVENNAKESSKNLPSQYVQRSSYPKFVCTHGKRKMSKYFSTKVAHEVNNFGIATEDTGTWGIVISISTTKRVEDNNIITQ